MGKFFILGYPYFNVATQNKIYLEYIAVDHSLVHKWLKKIFLSCSHGPGHFKRHGSKRGRRKHHHRDRSPKIGTGPGRNPPQDGRPDPCHVPLALLLPHGEPSSQIASCQPHQRGLTAHSMSDSFCWRTGLIVFLNEEGFVRLLELIFYSCSYRVTQKTLLRPFTTPHS